ncbi:unnamed protein product, partial [Iphiclides podalirius]
MTSCEIASRYHRDVTGKRKRPARYRCDVTIKRKRPTVVTENRHLHDTTGCSGPATTSRLRTHRGGPHLPLRHEAGEAMTAWRRSTRRAVK